MVTILVKKLIKAVGHYNRKISQQNFDQNEKEFLTTVVGKNKINVQLGFISLISSLFQSPLSLSLSRLTLLSTTPPLRYQSLHFGKLTVLPPD